MLEEDYKQYALDMEKKAEEKGVKLLIPVDNVVADDFSNDANFKLVERGGIPDGYYNSSDILRLLRLGKCIFPFSKRKEVNNKYGYCLLYTSRCV